MNHYNCSYKPYWLVLLLSTTKFKLSITPHGLNSKEKWLTHCKRKYWTVTVSGICQDRWAPTVQCDLKTFTSGLECYMPHMAVQLAQVVVYWFSTAASLVWSPVLAWCNRYGNHTGQGGLSQVTDTYPCFLHQWRTHIFHPRQNLPLPLDNEQWRKLQ